MLALSTLQCGKLLRPRIDGATSVYVTTTSQGVTPAFIKFVASSEVTVLFFPSRDFLGSSDNQHFGTRDVPLIDLGPIGYMEATGSTMGVRIPMFSGLTEASYISSFSSVYFFSAEASVKVCPTSGTHPVAFKLSTVGDPSSEQSLFEDYTSMWHT